MAERIDGVVVGELGVPKDGPPEANIDVLWVCRNRERDLLCARAIRGGSMLLGDDRDRACKFDVSRLQLPYAARQPHGEVVISGGDQYTGTLDARHMRDRVSKPRGIAKRPHWEHGGCPSVQ